MYKELLHNKETDVMLLKNDKGNLRISAPHFADRVYPKEQQIAALMRYIWTIRTIVKIYILGKERYGRTHYRKYGTD